MRNVLCGALRALPIAVFLAACGGDTDDDGRDGPGTGIDPVGTVAGEPNVPSNPTNAPMISFELTESDEELMNPERGFYGGYSILSPSSASRVRAEGHTLGIAMVRLDNFRTSPISASFLAQLETGFAAARAAGFKIVLRFAYNNSETEDASRAQILAHLTQLRPLLHANADVIAVVQGGFIGAWGEWHSSTNGLTNPADRTAIINAVLDAVPPERNVQIRRPMFKDEAFPGGPLSASEAYTGTKRARLGHHNDCFLASATDYGTYANPVATWEAYVGDDGRYTAIGGETCAVYAPRSNCEAAVDIMARGHWSYLNAEYNLAVIRDLWTAQGCRAEVERRLGYRFSLARVAHTGAIAPGGELDLQLDVANTGFAAPFNKRPIEIVLTDGTVRHVAQLDADARRWVAGTSTRLAVRLRIPATLAPGSYTLALRLPDDAASLADDPRYAIRLANEGLWDADTGDNLLSDALVVDTAAPGPRDASATGFIQIP